MMDARIGILVRNGRLIFYAYIDGYNDENYWERRTLEDMVDVLEHFDRKKG